MGLLGKLSTSAHRTGLELLLALCKGEEESAMSILNADENNALGAFGGLNPLHVAAMNDMPDVVERIVREAQRKRFVVQHE